MDKLKVQNSLFLVEKYDKARKDKNNPFTLDTNNNLGIVRFKADDAGDSVQVGDKVYFGIQNAERINIGGSEIYAMKLANIIAIIEETPNDDGQNK